MIETIGLHNFKAFKSLKSLDLKPITILCGTNSCGKSSILQSILLFKQTLESQNLNQTLLLNGRLVHLGSFENVTYQKNASNCVRFQFTFKIRKGEEYSSRRRGIPLYAIIRELLPRMTESTANDYTFRFHIGLLLDKSKNQYLRGTLVDHFSVEAEFGSGETPLQNMRINMQLQPNGHYYVEWSNLRSRIYPPSRNDDSSGALMTEADFINLFPLIIRSSADRAISDVSFTMNRFRDLVERVFSSYTYLGPLREEPSRRYIYEDEIVEIGSKGENAAYIYLNEKNREIQQYYTYDTNSAMFARRGRSTIGNAVREWLDLMGIKGLGPEPQNEIIYLNLDANTAEKTRVSIADVGFGVSQIFPVILEGIRMPMRSTLLLEQPEIHLHPNLQMQMADYFIALALSNKRVIVETHSDHIVNRLVRRIVEDDSGKFKDLINIYFIKPSESGSQYEQVEIDENKGIVNWPLDFFDQTATEQEKIIQAGIKKRKSKYK